MQEMQQDNYKKIIKSHFLHTFLEKLNIKNCPHNKNNLPEMPFREGYFYKDEEFPLNFAYRKLVVYYDLSTLHFII